MLFMLRLDITACMAKDTERQNISTVEICMQCSMGWRTNRAFFDQAIKPARPSSCDAMRQALAAATQMTTARDLP